MDACHPWRQGEMAGDVLVRPFFWGMHSTQRCEELNAIFNWYLNIKLKLTRFIKAFDRGLSWFRHTETHVTFDFEFGTKIKKSLLLDMEENVGAIFTWPFFEWLRGEIKNQDGWLVQHYEVFFFWQHRLLYMLWSTGNPIELYIKVKCPPKSDDFKCKCLMFESDDYSVHTHICWSQAISLL